MVTIQSASKGIFGLVLGIPQDAIELLPSVVPFGAGEYARREFDQTRRKSEDVDGGPRMPLARVQTSLIERFRHAWERQILDDHFRQRAKQLHLGGVFFQMFAVLRDAKTIG